MGPVRRTRKKRQQGDEAIYRERVPGVGCGKDKRFISPELRSVLTGSFVSQALLAASDPETIPAECPRCRSGAIGSWNHMMWECPAKPPGPGKPRSVVQCRLAWPMAKDDSYNEAVWAAAEELVRWTWNYRYGKGFDSSKAGANFGAPAMDAQTTRTIAA